MTTIADLRTLATDLCARRTDWTHGDVLNALIRVKDRPLVHIADAAWIVADTRPNAGPAIIALDGRHWQAPATGGTAGPTCLVCHRDKPGHDAAEARLHPDDRHAYDPRPVDPVPPTPEWRQSRPARVRGASPMAPKRPKTAPSSPEQPIRAPQSPPSPQRPAERHTANVDNLPF